MCRLAVGLERDPGRPLPSPPQRRASGPAGAGWRALQAALQAALLFSLMLAASKDKVLAELKQQSLCLRQLELEYYIKRYANIATQCVIIAGFAYDSLVEISISARMQEERPAVCTVYYAASSCTMAFAMYTVYVASFSTVFGHRLALQGPLGSVDRAVAVMMKQRTSIFVTFGLALLSLVASAVTMAWIRMDATGLGEIPANPNPRPGSRHHHHRHHHHRRHQARSPAWSPASSVSSCWRSCGRTNT